MQKEIKRIHVLQAGLVQGALGAAVGLVIGLLYGGIILLVGAAGAAASSTSSTGSGGPSAGELLAIMSGMGLAMVIIIPIVYGALGFIGGIIVSFVYNLIVKVVGGYKFDVEDISPPSSQF